MANIKSQKKRIETSEKARIANKSKRSRIATEVRKFREQVASKDFENATKQLQLVFSLIDRARLDNVYHQNTANRKKAALSKLLSDATKEQATAE